MKKRKKVFEGYTTKTWHVVWTVFNTLNLAFIIQKTKTEAMARYDDGISALRYIRKVRITIEEL
jgi:hypothetical protein